MQKFKITELSSGVERTVTLDEVHDAVEDIVGYELADNGVPYPIEVEGWAELAVVESVYEHEKFEVEVL